MATDGSKSQRGGDNPRTVFGESGLGKPPRIVDMGGVSAYKRRAFARRGRIAIARKMFRKSLLIHMPNGDLWEGTEYEIPDNEEIMAGI